MSIKEIILDLEECSKASLHPKNGFHLFMRDAQYFNPLLTIENQRICIQTYIDGCKSFLQRPEFSVSDRLIPKVTHKVWLTAADAPKLPQERVLISARDFYKSFPSGYTHKIWVNNEWIQEQLTEYFNEFDITFFNINKSDCHFTLNDNINLFLKDRKFAFACDLMRIELLAMYGGIYSDWGIKFIADIHDAIEKHRFTFILGDGGFFQNSLMACSSECPFFNKLVTLLNQPNLLARNVLKKVDATSEGWLAAGPLITTFFFLLVSARTKVLLLRGNDSCLKWAAQKSWYTQHGSELNGSSVVSETSPSLLGLLGEKDDISKDLIL